MLQVYKRMFQGMFTLNAFGEGGAAGEINEAADVAGYISQNREKIVNYLNSLDIRDARGMDAKDGQLRGLEVFRSEDKKAMDKILTAVGLDKSQLNEGVSIEEIANKIGAYTAESASVVSDTHSAQQEHYMGVSEVEQTVFAETTYANTGDINAIMFGVSREVLQDHTTVAVLEEIIGGLSATELKNFFYSLPTEYMENPGKSEFKKIMRDAGYQKNGLQFGKQERDTIFKVLEYYDKMNTAPRDQQISALLDFDGDMVIGIKKVHYAGEAQMRELLADTPNGFNNLLANLGLSNLDLNGNFFTARERFQTALGNTVASGLKPGILVESPSTLARYVDEQLDMQQDSASEIMEEVDQILLTDSRLAHLSSGDKARAIDAIKLEAVGIVLGDRSMGGASFDVRGATRNLIHNASVGVAQDENGTLVPGIALSRTVAEGRVAGRKVRVDAGVGAGLAGPIKFVPFVTVSGEIIKPTIEMDSLFDKNVKGKVAVSGFVNFTGKLSAGVVISKASEKTSMGINEMVNQMDVRLTQVLLDIKSGLGFDSATYEGKTPADRDMYNQISGLYTRGASRLTEAEKMVYIASIQAGFIENYASTLHANAEGYKLTGFGISYLAGCFPIPTIHGEKIYQRWEQDNDMVGTAAEHVVTEKVTSLDSVNGSMVQAGENNQYSAIYIPAIKEVYGDSSIQIQRMGDGFAISGDLTGKRVNINTHRSTTGESRVLNIINDDGAGVGDYDVLYDGATELMLLDEATTGITQSVQTGSRLVPSAQGTRAELDARGITGTWVQLKAATPGSAPVEGFKDVSRTDYLENRPPHGYEAIITAIDYVININTLKANTNLQEFQKMAFARQEGQNISQKALWEKLLPALNDSKISAALEVHNPGITQTLNALSTDKVADSEAIEWTMEGVLNAFRVDDETVGFNQADDMSSIKARLQGEDKARALTFREFTREVLAGNTNSRSTVFNKILGTSLGIDPELLVAAEGRILDRVGNMTQLRTAHVYGLAASTTAAAQKGTYGIRGGLQLNRVQEYALDQNGQPIKEYIQLDPTVEDLRIAKLPDTYINELTRRVGGNNSPLDVRRAIIEGGTLIDGEGKKVTFAYQMNYTITGNCLNGHVVEEVSITRTGRESTGFSGGTAGTAELGYYNTREDKLCITESQTTGTNKPVYGSIAGVLGVNMDRDDRGETAADTNPIEEPVELVDPTTSPIENGTTVDLGTGTQTGGSTDVSTGGSTGGTIGGGLDLGGATVPETPATVTPTTGGADGGLTGGSISPSSPTQVKSAVPGAPGFVEGTMTADRVSRPKPKRKIFKRRK